MNRPCMGASIILDVCVEWMSLFVGEHEYKNTKEIVLDFSGESVHTTLVFRNTLELLLF
jgi:hypothetical protein